jgi:ADP-heptose:LPS heptosyltransferase
MLKKVWGAVRPNPLDRLLKKFVKENKSRFLIAWNRGLGDIPLGLYGLIHRIRSFIPNASITFLTRSDLADIFAMLEGVYVLVGSKWERGKDASIEECLKEHNLSPNMFDVILERPDPTRWLKWQLGTITPKLIWREEWDAFASPFALDQEKVYVGAHVQTETGQYYGYEKNWSLPLWRDLFKRITSEKGLNILLFGLHPSPAFMMDGIIDLRGKTSLFEMLALIKNHCQYLIAPDSGVLSIAYYLNTSFPLRLISLWADPRQGVLRQKVESPNPQLQHIPLIGKSENVSNITINEVYHALFAT